ncbi:MAG: hypothetical protein ACRYF3_16785, partial [Janthinobacterium lividum]
RARSSAAHLRQHHEARPAGRPRSGGTEGDMDARTTPTTGVIIGMDPHKRSATIEVLDQRERLLGAGRFATDTTGYRDMLSAGGSSRRGRGRSRAPTASTSTSRSG